MKLKIFIISIALISCVEKNKVDACYCMQILLEKKLETKSHNDDWKSCLSLSKEFNFIQEMKNCKNYNNFIEEKVEENLNNLINPPLEKNIIIENITE